MWASECVNCMLLLRNIICACDQPRPMAGSQSQWLHTGDGDGHDHEIHIVKEVAWKIDR